MSRRNEPLEMAKFVERVFRSLVARAQEGDLEAVEALARLSVSSVRATKEAADAAWRSGFSYTQLGDALGISRQAARQRFSVSGRA